MRFGTITLHRTQNYGGLLQAHALQTVLRETGVDSEIIDYHSTSNDVEVSLERRPSVFNPRRFILHTLCRRMARGLIDLDLQASVRLQRTFAFMRESLPLSKPYRGVSELKEAQAYDVYLTGSDQVWSPHASRAGEYLLKFAPSAARRVSYGASFGVSEIPSELRGLYRQELARFRAISVREAVGVELVRGISGREAVTVLDPTLLLPRERWEALSRQSPVDTGSTPYTLCYFLGDFNVFMPFLEQLYEARRQRIVVLMGHRWGKKQYAVRNGELSNLRRFIRLLREQDKWTFAFDAGPREFLKHIANASYVLTDSFHGMTMAISFEKPFDAVVNTASRRRETSTRLRHLSNLLGLEGRVHLEVPSVSELTGKWDRAAICGALQKERGKSLDFIRSLVDGA